jgi:hypothetical protein
MIYININILYLVEGSVVNGPHNRRNLGDPVRCVREGGGEWGGGAQRWRRETEGGMGEKDARVFAGERESVRRSILEMYNAAT